MTIKISESKTADTRTCDYANVDRATLLASSVQHIADVQKALRFFGQMVERAAVVHDFDKLSDLDGFHRDFITGFAQTGWWDRHRALNRHHLLAQDGIPADINLIDILDFIADCTMAGMARSGDVYALNLPHEVLQRAFMNTCALLKAQIVVEKPDPAIIEMAKQMSKEIDAAIVDEMTLMGEILEELKHARSKFPGENVTTLAMVEEVGELAKATFEESRERVRKEAVQVATMAMRVVLDGDDSLTSWRARKGLDPIIPPSFKRADAHEYEPTEPYRGCAKCGVGPGAYVHNPSAR